MKAKDAVREIMATQGMGPIKLAARMRVEPPRVVTDRLAQENISIKKLNEMLAVLDYKIVLVPTDEKTKQGWYEIE